MMEVWSKLLQLNVLSINFMPFNLTQDQDLPKINASLQLCKSGSMQYYLSFNAASIMG